MNPAVDDPAAFLGQIPCPLGELDLLLDFQHPYKSRCGFREDRKTLGLVIEGGHPPGFFRDADARISFATEFDQLAEHERGFKGVGPAQLARPREVLELDPGLGVRPQTRLESVGFF